MNDRLGPHRLDGARDGRRVETVEHDRLGTQRAQCVGLARRSRAGDHLMSGTDEHRNQPLTDSATRPRDENSHDVDSYDDESRRGVATHIDDERCDVSLRRRDSCRDNYGCGSARHLPGWRVCTEAEKAGTEWNSPVCDADAGTDAASD
jgi:hypothetical protein